MTPEPFATSWTFTCVRPMAWRVLDVVIAALFAGVGFLVLAPGLGEMAWVVWVVLVAFAVIPLRSRVLGLTVTRAGLRIHAGARPLVPVRSIPFGPRRQMSRVLSARVGHVTAVPIVSRRRVLLTETFAARTGEAVVIEFAQGHTLRVTVDRAAEAAALINALVAERVTRPLGQPPW